MRPKRDRRIEMKLKPLTCTAVLLCSLLLVAGSSSGAASPGLASEAPFTNAGAGGLQTRADRQGQHALREVQWGAARAGSAAACGLCVLAPSGQSLSLTGNGNI